MAGRKPIRDVKKIKIGESFEASYKEAMYSRQFRYNYEKQTGIKFHVERWNGKVIFKRVA